MRIQCDEDYRKALLDIVRLMDLKPPLGTPESDQIIALGAEIEAWEIEVYGPILLAI